MRIVIAAEIFPPDIGGPATYSADIANALSERGWDVKLICYSNRRYRDTYNFPVIRITRSEYKQWHYIKYFFRLFLMSLFADIIYAQGPVSSGKPATIIGRILGKKVVVKVVGDYAWEQARNSGYTEAGIDEFQKMKVEGRIAALRETQQETVKEASFVIVPSVYLKNIVFGWGASQSKIRVIYNSVTLPQISHKLERDKNVIVSIGRLVPWKGFDTLIKIMPSLLAENKYFRLEIIGSGPIKSRLESFITELHLEKSISISSLPREEALNRLSKAGVFILNSGYEGLSHTILEALSLRVPVIASNIGGNSEIIKNGENGILVSYNDEERIKEAILRLYKDDSLVEKFSREAEKVLNMFSRERMVSETVNLLKLLSP